MDQARLAAVIQRAEEIGAESPDFMGLSLGQIYKGCPEEIYSGRVVARGRRSDAHKSAKAYTKFVQAFRELEATLPPVSASSLARPPLHKSSKGRPPRDPAAGVLACLPLQAAVTPESSENSILACLKQSEKPKSGKSQRAFPARAAAHVWQARKWTSLKWIGGTAITLLLPNMTVRLVGLGVQLGVTAVAHGSRQLVQSTLQETNRLGNTFVDIIEQSLDICLDEPASPPALSPAQTAQLFATAEAMQSGEHGQNSTEILSKLLGSVPLLAPPPPPQSAGFKLPGWALILIGVAAKAYV